MFNISKSTVVYVVCPYYFKTGGTELAHQLVATINELGGKAIITYYGGKDAIRQINPAFSEYVDTYIDISQIVDDKKNIVILPEINPDLLNHLKQIQKSVWWMSVDNYLKRNGVKGFYQYFGLLKTVRHLFWGNIKIGGLKIDKEIVHLYQSEYAHQFLLNNGVKHTHRLSDYINQIYLVKNDKKFSSKNNKKNQILYNPKKGIEFTQKIMGSSDNLNWIPIENMTTEEVRDLLSESKVYIDFGNHPGKDRFPREAAISGCCIITGKLGSANYFEDIPIPDEYKFESKDENISKILSKIKECLEEYKKKQEDFLGYKKFIEKEYSVFRDDVRELFICSNNQEMN